MVSTQDGLWTYPLFTREGISEVDSSVRSSVELTPDHSGIRLLSFQVDLKTGCLDTLLVTHDRIRGLKRH